MSGGFGHIRAGEALLDYAKENLPNIHAEHFDVSNINISLKKYAKIYDFLNKRFPFVWGAMYKYFSAPIAKKIISFGGLFNSIIKNYIFKKNPDGIIFTNVIILPMFISALHNKFTNIKMGVVVTDYHGHPYYNFSSIDCYFVANDKVKNDFQKIGMNKEKIAVTGIPINPRFYIKQNIKDLKLKYGINNNLPVVIFIASFRVSRKDLVESVKQLVEFRQKINLVFIANGNKEFYNLIRDNFLGAERFFLVDWTNFMEEYIKISDIVISKAGGLTVSECMSLKKQMIIVNPIPGQEEYNADFVENNNLGVRVKKINEIAEVLPKMIPSKKNNPRGLVPKENPCEKIFQYFI